MAYHLGVDLGTTFTAAGLVRGGELNRPEPVTLGTRGVTVPSAVYVSGDRLVVGEPAVRRAATEPSRVAREFKRRVGDSTPLMLDGTPVAPDALMARMLEWVVGQVASTEGSAPSSLAVTHPANWGEFKLDVLRRALDDLGLRPDHLVPEPVAAASFYASQRELPPGAVVAVYDLGGGTFDAAVVQAGPDGFRIAGRPDGIERLGGVDFDYAVLRYVASSVGIDLDDLDETDVEMATGLVQLRDECVRAKEALAVETDVAIPIMLPDLHTQVRLTRAELESMVRPGLEETLAALDRTIASAGVVPRDVSAVLLVGGSSRIPFVAQLVAGELGRPVAVDARPKDAICLGAALVAADARARATIPSGPERGTAMSAPPPVAEPPIAHEPPTVAGSPTPPGPPSPVGGVPAEPRGAPPSAGRGPLLVGLALLVVVALVGVVFLVRDPGGDGDRGGPGGRGEPVVSSGTCGGGPQLLDDDLVLLECGQSTLRGRWDEDRYLGSFGLILENTGDAPQVDVLLEVSVLAGGGDVMATTTAVVMFLGPGQKTGVGGVVRDDDVDGELATGDIRGDPLDSPIADVQVGASTPGSTDCQDEDGSGLRDRCRPPPGSAEVSGVEVTGDQSGMRTTFHVESSYPGEVGYALSYVVFRDSSGDIVGGHAGTDVVPLSPTDSTRGTVDADGLLEIDDARTEVYLHPVFL